ncbi:hypothetical protein SB761_27100, partial [Pseudomonas sp. SIMBA_064]
SEHGASSSDNPASGLVAQVAHCPHLVEYGALELFCSIAGIPAQRANSLNLERLTQINEC